ncbi:MAG: hypothetical protein FWB88_07610 [Defluviitaleaceae bacterium]|nr:hypothetical protein [Defluviitaleaceae bacterium]MCL2203790.1 hypothetical protein [Defluviitaleaceae bacterium]MCL2239259.1 hypothetical protein [Defluviitaleaceae bacterium]
MATNFEKIADQRRRLFMLLRLNKARQDKVTLAKILKELISETEAEMQEEDVAYVEKKIAQLDISTEEEREEFLQISK